jgi:hypothetical protein
MVCPSFSGGIGSSNSSLVATATTTTTTTTTTSQQQHGSEVVAALDGKGRRLMTLVEKGEGNNTNNRAEAVKEDFRQGKWRGKATGKASARSAAVSSFVRYFVSWVSDSFLASWHLASCHRAASFRECERVALSL